MKKLLFLLMCGVLFTACKNESDKTELEPTVGEVEDNATMEADSASVNIDPVSHATAVINWGEDVIYLDPVGGAEAFQGKENPDFVLITDIHGDHMNVETLKALNLGNTKIVVPQAVKDSLPQEMNSQVIVLNNGETTELMGYTIEAIPMYNLPEDPKAFHPKGRGNGYVLERNGKRLYIAGDTEAIPEMKNLQNIDMALVPMNLPYTMDVDQAAEGVIAFAPKTVYPYHFRGTEGFADVDKFKQLVNESNKNINVEMLEWYPNR